MPTRAVKTPHIYRTHVLSGRPVPDLAKGISHRNARVLADRLRHALHHPYSQDAVLLDVMAATVLLERIEHGLLQGADQDSGD